MDTPSFCSIFSQERPPDTVIVIFGASGDLTTRKLLPALYSLYEQGKMPARFRIIGTGRRQKTPEDFIAHIKGEVAADFRDRLSYFQLTYDEAGISGLKDHIAAVYREGETPPNYLYYFATPPSVFHPVSDLLDRAGMINGPESSRPTRAVFEKPFGHDLESARKLNHSLLAVYREDQIFRIDHYLGKEAVQNLLIFRFANPIFSPVWHRDYIDHIQINASETLGIMERGAYFDSMGVLRDMVQNHLLQLVCLLTMTPPDSFDADEIRGRKVKVIDSLCPECGRQPERYLIRGQYRGYRDEPGVAPDSTTETFAAMKLKLGVPGMEDVPVYLRSGKNLQRKGTEIAVVLKPSAYGLFRQIGITPPTNRIIFKIQPAEGIIVEIAGKTPSGGLDRLTTTELNFTYGDQYPQPLAEAYETLLLDVLRGNSTLFVRSDETESAWAFLNPFLDYATGAGRQELEIYPPGSDGPAAAHSLPRRDGREWIDFSRYDHGR